MKALLPVAALAIAATAVPALAVDGSSAESGRKLSTSLSGATEVPGPGDSDGRGAAEVRVNPGQGSVCYKVTYSGIDAPAAAHIHSGAAGVAGGVVVGLSVGAGGVIEGCTGVTRELAQALIQGPDAFYVNVHNAAFPNGAIRGQLGK